MQICKNPKSNHHLSEVVHCTVDITCILTHTSCEVLDVVAFEVEPVDAGRLLVDDEHLLVAVAHRHRLVLFRVGGLRGEEAGRTAGESADGHRVLNVAIDAE